MVKSLHAQVQVGRENFEIVQVTFNDINVVNMKVKENVTTKAIDKVRFTKYNKIFAKCHNLSLGLATKARARKVIGQEGSLRVRESVRE